MAKRTTKKAQTLSDIAPYIKAALIHRWTDEKATEAITQATGHEMSTRTYQRYKKEYNEGNTQRFLDIANSEWASEHLLVIDIIKEIEAQYWEIYKDAETATEAKNILDSISRIQEQKVLMYNETPMIAKMKETLEAKLEELRHAQNKAKNSSRL
jgi:hypothetical protein